MLNLGVFRVCLRLEKFPSAGDKRVGFPVFPREASCGASLEECVSCAFVWDSPGRLKWPWNGLIFT